MHNRKSGSSRRKGEEPKASHRPRSRLNEARWGEGFANDIEQLSQAVVTLGRLVQFK
jgi:hypothetical protein